MVPVGALTQVIVAPTSDNRSRSPAAFAAASRAPAGARGCPRAWQSDRVRHSVFWQLMEEEFGVGYARSVAHDQTIGALDGRTAQQALDAGEAPRTVWLAVCDAMDVPASRRLGRDLPPARRGPSR